MGLGTLVLAGIGSALVIAGRAADAVTGPAAETTEARLAADRITADLNHALRFIEQGPNGLTFTVPDRDGDGSEETIGYACSETSGEPLTRQYNAGPAVTILEDIRQFDLRYLARPVAALPLVENAPGMLIAHGPGSGGGSQEDYSVDQSHWCGQWFKPGLPSNAVSWKVSSVQFLMRRYNPGRQLRVEIRTATARQTPTDEILEASEIYSDQLPDSYGWWEISFSGVSGLDPFQGVCLVIRQMAGSAGAKVQYHENGYPMTPSTHWTTTGNTGGSWDRPVSNKDLLFYAYGTVTTKGPAQWQ